MSILKNKKFLVSFIIALAIMAGISSYYIKTNSVSDANKSDTNKIVKVVGSDNFSGFRIPAKSIDELVANADAVIIGTVVSDAVTKAIPMHMPEKAQEKLEQKTQQKEDGTTYNVAECNILVEQVIDGDASLEGKEIDFWQLGDAGNDNLQTKVKKNHKMLFVLKKAEQENTYASIDFEDGLFDIDKNGKTISLSNNEATAKYDNSDIADLKKDILKAKKNK